MKLMRVTAVDHEKQDGEVVIQLAGRDEDGERRTLHVEQIIPYFYIRKDEVHIVEEHDAVLDIQYGYESAIEDIPLARVDVRLPGNAGGDASEENLTELFDRTWQSDIPFYRQASMDYNLSGYIRVPDTDRCSIDDIETDVEINGDEIIDPRVMIADIEVIPDEDMTFEEMCENYDSPITHISMWDSYEDEYIALHLDPEGQVDNHIVSSLLDEHCGSESLSREREQDIIIRSYDSPESLMAGFLKVIEERQPDLTSGWNWIDFDWDYILNYMDGLDADISIHDLSDIGWVNGYQVERKVDCFPAFDMLSAYKKMTIPLQGKKRSWSLDYVAKEELGVGKLPNVNIQQTYENERHTLLAYNIIDTMLCVAIERGQSVHDFFFDLAELSQVQVYDTFSEMRLVDGYIMSRATDNEILPTADDKDIPENAGGLVLDPSDGVKEWVGVLDLASLYPSSFITWNLSPETIHWYDEETPEDLGIESYMNVPWMPDADHADGGSFAHDEIKFDVMWVDLEREGLIPKYLRRLFPERQERKDIRDQYDPDDPLFEVWDRKQAAVKVIMNAFYGVSSMDYWRLAVYGLGDAITSTSRYALWQGKEVAIDEDYEVYYGDTDSIMLEVGVSGKGKQAALTRGKSLEDAINNRMHECVDASGLTGKHPYIGDDLHGTDRHALEYEFEKLYRRFIQVGTKKRYAGRIVWKEGKDKKGEIDTVGFESQRSDSPELTEEIQPEVINRILGGEEFNDVSSYVQDLIGDIETGDMDLYKVALPKSLGQPLTEYGNTQTARACRYSNQNLGKSWKEGDSPWLYFVRKTPPMEPGTDVIALNWDEDIPDGFELDMSKTLDRSCKGPLLPILREVGWRWTEVKEGAKTQSAADASWGAVEDDDDDEDEWGSW